MACEQSDFLSRTMEEIRSILNVEENHECVSTLRDVIEDLHNLRIKMKLLQDARNSTEEEIMSELQIFGLKFETPLEGVKHLCKEYLSLKVKIKEEDEARNYEKVLNMNPEPSNNNVITLVHASESSESEDCFSETEEENHNSRIERDERDEIPDFDYSSDSSSER